MRSMQEQCAAIREQWPGFRCTKLANGGAMWVGELRPLSQAYTVSMSFGPPLAKPLEMHIHLTANKGIPRRPMHRLFPVVRVVEPELHFPHSSPEGKRHFPHVYMDLQNPVASPLCLFDPRRGEWTYDDLIAETTIAWTADWLCCYEGWLATGRWLGGGSHVGRSLSDEF